MREIMRLLWGLTGLRRRNVLNFFVLCFFVCVFVLFFGCFFFFFWFCFVLFCFVLFCFVLFSSFSSFFSLPLLLFSLLFYFLLSRESRKESRELLIYKGQPTHTHIHRHTLTHLVFVSGPSIKNGSISLIFVFCLFFFSRKPTHTHTHTHLAFVSCLSLRMEKRW